ncbi:MAG: hypothetical protein CYPHOPRED_004703, partial [Cyphobasidiales sp. Tagirdzhanova-0007]
MPYYIHSVISGYPDNSGVADSEFRPARLEKLLELVVSIGQDSGLDVRNQETAVPKETSRSVKNQLRQ